MVLTPENHEECQPKSPVNSRGLTCVKQTSIGAVRCNRHTISGERDHVHTPPIGERVRSTQALLDDRPPKPLTAEARTNNIDASISKVSQVCQPRFGTRTMPMKQQAREGRVRTPIWPRQSSRKTTPLSNGDKQSNAALNLLPVLSTLEWSVDSVGSR